MDSYSGRFPLDFISFYIGMTTEVKNTAGVTSESSRPEETVQSEPNTANVSNEPRPPFNFSTSSEATEESLSTYAERTVKDIIARDNPGTSGISTLLPPLTEHTEETSKAKASEPGEPGVCIGAGQVNRPSAVEKKTNEEQNDPDDASVVSIPAISRTIDPSQYFTDTSEIGDLMDSPGVGGPVTPQAKDSSIFIRVLRQEE